MIGMGAAFAPVLRSSSRIEVRENAAPPRATGSSDPADVKPFELDEITIAELQEGMKSGKYTARSITELYLAGLTRLIKTAPASTA